MNLTNIYSLILKDGLRNYKFKIYQVQKKDLSGTSLAKDL